MHHRGIRHITSAFIIINIKREGHAYPWNWNSLKRPWRHHAIDLRGAANLRQNTFGDVKKPVAWNEGAANILQTIFPNNVKPITLQKSVLLSSTSSWWQSNLDRCSETTVLKMFRDHSFETQMRWKLKFSQHMILIFIDCISSIEILYLSLTWGEPVWLTGC